MICFIGSFLAVLFGKYEKSKQMVLQINFLFLTTLNSKGCIGNCNLISELTMNTYERNMKFIMKKSNAECVAEQKFRKLNRFFQLFFYNTLKKKGGFIGKKLLTKLF